MPLTPADVHNVAFKKPPIGKRGYDEDEVDAFLDEIEREFARLIEENNELKGQGGGPAGRPDAAAGSDTGLEAVSPSGADRRLARENAELKSQLQELEQRLQQAREGQPSGPSDSEQALSVLMTAQRTANEHVADARREADKLLGDALTKADELKGSAKSTADDLEKDARDKYQEAMGGLEVQRQSLQKHIEELKAFEREYRSRLKAYLEGQLRDLDGKAAAVDGAGRPVSGAASAGGGQSGAGAAGSPR